MLHVEDWNEKAWIVEDGIRSRCLVRPLASHETQKENEQSKTTTDLPTNNNGICVKFIFMFFIISYFIYFVYIRSYGYDKKVLAY